MLAHGWVCPHEAGTRWDSLPCIDKPTCFGLRQENLYRLDALAAMGSANDYSRTI